MGVAVAMRFCLFLDVDGVLHPINQAIPTVLQAQRGSAPVGREGQPFSRLPLLEQTIRPYLEHIEIVISSSWRLDKRAHQRLLSALSADVRQRVIATTGLPRFTGTRFHDISAWLREHRDPEIVAVILDDLPDHYGLGKLGIHIKPDADIGFTQKEALKLTRILQGEL